MLLESSSLGRGAEGVVFRPLPNLGVFAGAGLARDKLVPLFRHGIIKRIDQVFEFRLDRRRLSESPAPTSPGEELRKALQELEPMPSTFASLLATRSQVGWCDRHPVVQCARAT